MDRLLLKNQLHLNQLIADNAKILEGSRPADETTTEETTAE